MDDSRLDPNVIDIEVRKARVVSVHGDQILTCSTFRAWDLESIASRRFSLCHIDVDVYESARDIFDWVWPRMAPGGVVVFDDYGFRGCVGITMLGEDLRARQDLVFIHNMNGHALLVKTKS